MFGKAGRTWLEAQPELDRIGAELTLFDQELARRALADKRVERLMTIGGVNAVVAASVLAAIRRRGPILLTREAGELFWP